jgi:hypothetical protein
VIGAPLEVDPFLLIHMQIIYGGSWNMPNNDIALMAHLLRRAGFGATWEELEAYCAKGYKATVEELLHPENAPDIEDDLVSRYQAGWTLHDSNAGNNHYWLYRMVNTRRPLEEKLTLFWHSILCVSHAKFEDEANMWPYIEMLRRHGLGDFRTLLVALSRHPAMVFYLDNCMSHKGAINENYGRELLELFSMGVGMDEHPNYTEDDVKACARALTGWTHHNRIPRFPYGGYYWGFKYDPTDHDDDEKTFLGETGRFNGEDVVDIIVRQPACVRFVARHLYDFFVADEVPVPAWQNTSPRDPEAIRTLETAFEASNYEIRSVLRVLFNSDFFKNSLFARVKSPADLVVGVARLVGDFKEPKPGFPEAGFPELDNEMRYMGMQLVNPPTVEGWHTGKGWIDSGTLVERINFATNLVGNTNLPGVRAIVNRLAVQNPLSPQQFVEGCLDLMGPMELSKDTKQILVKEAGRGGELRNTTAEERIDFARRVGEMLQLITATQEFQFC